MHPFHRQRNRGLSWDLSQVSCFSPEDSAFRALPLHLLWRVTCESDSQVSPALPAGPGECDSCTFPVTHTSHSSSGQQAWSLGSRTPAFLTLPKNSCTSSSQESTLLPRRYQQPGEGKHLPTVTQRRSSTAGGGGPGVLAPSPLLASSPKDHPCLASLSREAEERMKQGQNAL